MIVGRCLNKHVVLNYHSGEAADHLSHWGPLVHPWLGLAHDLVVPSPYLQMVFAQHGYSTRVVPNVVDVACFEYHERAPLRPRILSTRNLEPYYRVDLVIQAFARFSREVPDATLTIAGYGSEEQRLRELAVALGCGDVRFTGRVAPDDMPRLYADHDMFVNASVLDNQPVSILEAFARVASLSGLPMKSVYVDANREGDHICYISDLSKMRAHYPLWNITRCVQGQPGTRGSNSVTRGRWFAQEWLDIYSEGTRRDEIAIGAESLTAPPRPPALRVVACSRANRAAISVASVR